MTDIAEEYRSSLSELNFNSKPHINMLTMLAEENAAHAAVIVQTIVDHINSVSIKFDFISLIFFWTPCFRFIIFLLYIVVNFYLLY